MHKNSSRRYFQMSSSILSNMMESIVCFMMHSSKALTIMRFFAGCNPSSSWRSNLKACMKSLWNWTVMDLTWIEHSAYNIDSRYGCILGMDVTSCHASVRNSWSETPQSDVLLWKKKDAASCVSWKCSAMVWAMADFPAPAGLLSQKIRWGGSG